MRYAMVHAVLNIEVSVLYELTSIISILLSITIYMYEVCENCWTIISDYWSL